MKKTIVLIAALALAGIQGTVIAADAAAGKAKAASCAGCHGANGHAPNPAWPNLAGQNAPYLVAQLKAFKSGARSNPMMSPMAKPLSDADMDNLAAHYSGLK